MSPVFIPKTPIENHAKLLVMYLFIADFDPGSTMGSKLTIAVHTERKQNLVIIIWYWIHSNDGTTTPQKERIALMSVGWTLKVCFFCSRWRITGQPTMRNCRIIIDKQSVGIRMRDAASSSDRFHESHSRQFSGKQSAYLHLHAWEIYAIRIFPPGSTWVHGTSQYQYHLHKLRATTIRND